MSPHLPKSLRTVLLAGHIFTAVGWMVMGVMLTAQDFSDLVAPYPPDLAVRTLAPTACLAVATGLLLSTFTAYRLCRYWWVLVKAVVSVILLGYGLASWWGWLPDGWVFAGRVAALGTLWALLVVSVAKPRARVRYRRQPRHAPR